MRMDSLLAFFISHLRYNLIEIGAGFFFEDLCQSRYQGIVILGAFHRAMAHALAEIEEFGIESEAGIDPAIDVGDGIMVSEGIGRRMRRVTLIPESTRKFVCTHFRV